MNRGITKEENTNCKIFSDHKLPGNNINNNNFAGRMICILQSSFEMIK